MLYRYQGIIICCAVFHTNCAQKTSSQNVNYILIYVTFLYATRLRVTVYKTREVYCINATRNKDFFKHFLQVKNPGQMSLKSNVVSLP